MVPTLNVVTRDGTTISVSGQEGPSVMETIRDAGIDELAAICGGSCSCGTCHVYIDSAFTGMLPPMSADEDDLLDSSSYRRPESRLTCQIPFSAALDGLSVTIAPEE